MTNFEYYEDKILQLISDNEKIGLYNSEPVNCNTMGCYGCDLELCNCRTYFIKWLYQEYIPDVDWSKVEVDTPVLVSDDGENWLRRYFAKYENNIVYAYLNGATSWSSNEHPVAWEYVKLKEE